jgi:hypothetical protein
MKMQQNLIEKSSEFERPGEASRGLWLLLMSMRGSADASRTSPSETLGVDPLESLGLSVPGRYARADGTKHFCRATEISAFGITMRGGAIGFPGEWIVAHMRGLGAIEGVISQKGEDDFVLDLREPPEHVERLSRRIIWLVRRSSEVVPERRGSERILQHQRKAYLRTADGREMLGDMLDLSASGAAVHLGVAALYFWVGQPVALDDRPGQVLRQFPGGVVVKFDEDMDVDLSAVEAELPKTSVG